jgi:hypothetical protein
MKPGRAGMALPAAIAAAIMLAGLATLANISATAAIRESRALRDVAVERMQLVTMRARAWHHLRTHPRDELIRGSVLLGAADTTLATIPFTWPWHTVAVTVRGSTLFAEFARASVPEVPWCNAVVYVSVAHIGDGTLTPASACTDRLQVSAGLFAAFDSVLATDLAGIGNGDTLTLSGPVSGVLRATRSVSLVAGTTVTGVVIAPVVRMLGGASVQGLVVARDSLTVVPGASVTADFSAVFSALKDRSRLVMAGRRGLLLQR